MYYIYIYEIKFENVTKIKTIEAVVKHKHFKKISRHHEKEAGGGHQDGTFTSIPLGMSHYKCKQVK